MCTVFYCFIIELARSISDQVNRNLHGEKISSICQIDSNNQVTFTGFSFPEPPPSEMIEGLTVLAKEYHNNIFEYAWKKNSESFCMNRQNMSDVSFSDVTEKVWKPTIFDCQMLLSKVYDKSITLAEVMVYGHLEDLDHHLQTLCLGMCKCFPNSKSFPTPGEWIKHVINHMITLQRFSVGTKKNGIAYCLTLKESLKLKGNFSVLEDLHQQVSYMQCSIDF